MEETTKVPTVRSTGIRYGVIMGVIGIIVFVIFSILNVDQSGPARYISLPINIAIIILAHIYFKQNGDGFMSYGQGLGISFWIGLIGAAISSAFTYIFIRLIDDSMIQMIKDKQFEELQSQGMSDAQFDQAMKIMEIFTIPEVMFAVGFIIGIIAMVVMGLIISIFTQRSNPQPASF